jgi:broad specificity phosphatase PhoE
MKLILVRHGETEGNKKNIAQGWSDGGLSDNGRKQARLVSERLKNTKVDAIYSSDLSRAKETAEIIAKPHGLKVILMKDLREQNFGKANGMERNEINKKFDNFLERRQTEPDAAAPEGESFRQLMERIKNAIDIIYRKHKEGTVVVVTHGGDKRAAMWALGVMGFEDVWKHFFGNTSVTEVELKGEKAIIMCLNCTKHIV